MRPQYLRLGHISWLMFFMYLITECFGAILLYLLGFIHLESIFFVRDLFFVFIILFYFLRVVYEKRVNWILATVILTISISIIWSIINIHNIPLALFGIKLSIPLVVGGILHEFNVYAEFIKHRKAIKFLLLLTLLGIFLNLFFLFPWESMSLTLGQLEVEGSRLWTQYGTTFRRLSGFTRGSNTAASLVALFYIPFLVSTKSTFKRVALFFVALIAILLTTMKSVLLAFIVINVLFVFRQLSTFSKLYPIFSFLLITAIPLSSLTLINYLSEKNIYIFSLWDRMQGAWPEAIELIHDSGNSLLGRGIGGLGTSQLYFEHDLYNPGDNMFIHIWANYGIIFLILLIGVFFLATKLKIRKNKSHMIIFLYVCFLITNGLTSSITLGALQNIVLIYSLLFISRAYKNEKRYSYNYYIQQGKIIE